MPLAISMILFSEKPVCSAADVVAALATHWPDLPAITAIEEKDAIISFDLGDANVAILTVAAPFPWSDLEGPCETSVLWQDATATLREHKSHAIVTVRGEFEPVAMSTLLTQVSTAILAAAPSSLGVYWPPATLVVPKNIFTDFAVEVMPQGAPLAIWVDYRVGWTADKKTSAGFTTGLAGLGLMELETQAAPESPGDLRARFEAISGYLLEHGLVIQDGDTLGETATEKIRVVYADSGFGAEGQVMRLVFESAEKKPWWKPW